MLSLNKLQLGVDVPPNSDAFLWKYAEDVKLRHAVVLSKLRPFGALPRKRLLDR